MSDSTESVVAPVALEQSSAAVGSVPDAATSLGAEVDSLFGYRAPASPTTTAAQEPDDETEGAPPSPLSETSDEQGATETAQPEQAGAPPAEAGRTDDDPLQHAEPLSYTVSGQTRSDERIKVVKDLGAFIEPKDLPHIQQRLSERDHLYETSRAQFEKYATLEKLTEWKQGDTVLTGPQAIEAQRVFVEQSKETIRQLASVLRPENFAKFVDIGQNEDGSYFVQPNQAALNDLRERLQFGNEKAGFEEKRRFAALAPTVSQPVAPQADAPIESLAEPTVDALAQQLGVTLAPDAKAFLAQQLPRYVRATTEAEKPQFGARIVDASFGELIQREARSAATVAKVAETASTAATRNAPRLAAAMIGRKPHAPAVPRKQTPQSDEDELSQEEQAYLARERAGAAALRARAS